MRYKVGQKVRVKSLDWYNENKNEFGNVKCSWCCFLTKEMSIHCGSILTVEKVVDGGIYWMEENQFNWADEMIEGLVEEEKQQINPHEFWVMLGEEECNQEITLPDGYQFKDENGNVINATKIVLEKKKKKYPKTYEECKIVLDITTPMARPDYKGQLIVDFQKLLICRDAYWKIAGEEMGLGKQWEPDLVGDEVQYFIFNYNNQIDTSSGDTENHILAFPTEEMRDAFYENFKRLIEKCKELL